MRSTWASSERITFLVHVRIWSKGRFDTLVRAQDNTFPGCGPSQQDTFVTRQSSDPIANTPPSLSQLTGAHKVYNHFSVLLGLKTFAFSCSHYKALRPRGKRLGQPLQVHTPHQKSSDMCSYRSRRSSRDIVHLLTPCPGVPQTLTVLTSEERNHEGMF